MDGKGCGGNLMSEGMQKAIDDVQSRPCQCVRCSECRGTGNVWFSFPGPGRGRYLGSSRCDDLDEMETCDDCGGSGIVETCDRCQELDELYRQQEDEEEVRRHA